MSSPPLDLYRPPAEAPATSARDGSGAAALLLCYVALVPPASSVMAFATPIVLGALGQPVQRTTDVLPWERIVQVVGAAAAWAGVARLGQRASRALSVAAAGLSAITAVSVFLRLVAVTPTLGLAALIAASLHSFLVQPAFMVLLALSCRRILGVGLHPWLVRVSVAAPVAAAAAELILYLTPSDTPTVAIAATSLAIHLISWMTPSLLLWRLRERLLLAPASLVTP